MTIHRYGFPTEIHFGAGARGLIRDKLAALGANRTLIVTDSSVAGLPFFPEIEALTPNAAVFSGFAGNPVLAHVAAGTAAYKNHGADTILTIGGGAAIDVAKAIAAAINHPGNLFDYAEGTAGQKPLRGKIPRILAIPTTAGTGSEVGRSAVISDDLTHRKRIIFSPALLPAVVLVDPELTVGLPPGITAATGMDAVTHLVEAYLTPAEYNPLCDGIALEGLRLAEKSLRRCVSEPKDISARGDMQNAALMGAVAFQKGLGAVHSCAHALSTVVDMHHGLANGIMLPYVMKFNRPAVEEKFAALARTLGVEDFVDWTVRLKTDISIPATLGEAGLTAAHLAALVDVAVDDICHPLNPKAVTRADFENIFRRALGSAS